MKRLTSMTAALLFMASCRHLNSPWVTEDTHPVLQALDAATVGH
jgi:hypothetical protein